MQFGSRRDAMSGSGAAPPSSTRKLNGYYFLQQQAERWWWPSDGDGDGMEAAVVLYVMNPSPP